MIPPLEKLLETFRREFAKVSYSMIQILKSLTRFEDAEQEPMPDMLVPLEWDEVKQFFCREVPPLSGRFGAKSEAKSRAYRPCRQRQGCSACDQCQASGFGRFSGEPYGE